MSARTLRAFIDPSKRVQDLPQPTSPRHQTVRGVLCQNASMPRYFIDIHDGTEVAHDEAGYELPDLDAARTQAVGIMIRQVRRLADGPGQKDYVTTIRDADGIVRLRFNITIDTGPIG